MTDLPELRTSRLLLRALRHGDRSAFDAMNADPRVMEHFPAPLDRAGSDAMATRIAEHASEHGFSFWAVEAPGVAEFIGVAGLLVPGFKAHFTPCVEIGWRFAHEFWGRGYATEAALALLDHAFGRLGLDEVVAMAVPANTRSRRVMERIGMTRDTDGDFDHPYLPEGHRLRRHVLYRLPRSARTGPEHRRV